MFQLTFNPGLTLTGFRKTRPWSRCCCCCCNLVPLGGRCSSEILKRTPTRYKYPVLRVWLKCFHPWEEPILELHINRQELFSKTSILLVVIWEKSEGEPALVWSQGLLALRMFKNRCWTWTHNQTETRIFWFQFLIRPGSLSAHALIKNCRSSKSRMISHACLTPFCCCCFFLPRCGERGFCLAYDHDGLAKVVLGVLLVCKGLTTTTFCLSWLFSRRQTGYNNTRTAVDTAL